HGVVDVDPDVVGGVVGQAHGGGGLGRPGSFGGVAAEGAGVGEGCGEGLPPSAGRGAGPFADGIDQGGQGGREERGDEFAGAFVAVGAGRVAGQAGCEGRWYSDAAEVAVDQAGGAVAGEG